MTIRKAKCWVCAGTGIGLYLPVVCLRCEGRGWCYEHYTHRTFAQWLGDAFARLLDAVERSYVSIINWLDHIDMED